MSLHLGGLLTSFVDGELDDVRHEQVLVHLANCDGCRREVQLLRGLKSSLGNGVEAPDHLAARLLSMTTAPVVLPRPMAPRRRVLDGHRRLRRTAFGLGALALGVGGSLMAAGPRPSTPVLPVDPTSAGLVQEHVSTSQEVPFAGVEVLPASNPAP